MNAGRSLGQADDAEPETEGIRQVPKADASTFLQGVKILDLSQYISGPFATLMLADFGAEVIKVESLDGDAMRLLGPRDSDGTPLFHGALNAQKSLFQLDLKSPGGLATLYRLLADCDVLVEGFRPGVMARLGLSYEELQARFPRLIYCSISGYGATGPCVHVAGHDGNYLASSGIMERNGSDAPIFYDPPLADMSGALFAAVAILAALYGRVTSQRGTHIDLGLADVLMPLQLLQVAGWSVNPGEIKRESTYLNGGAAYYQVYQTADDRHVMVGAIEPKFWSNLCSRAGHEEWIVRQDEPCPQIDLRRDMAHYFMGMNLHEVVSRFGKVDCCVSVVQKLGEALTDPQLVARGLVPHTPHGMQALFPALFDGEPVHARKPLNTVVQMGEGVPCDGTI